MIYILFLCSGISGLVYQVVWVRQFANVFGNTVYSGSLVVAIFMLGLGLGGYVLGCYADRQAVRHPGSLLRVYGYVELVIAALGFLVSLALPRLGVLSALMSSYVLDDAGWFVLSPASYVARGATALTLLGPIAFLMGGTLTLLIRDRVRHNVEVKGAATIALLYGANTVGAAVGALLTDLVLVPAVGLLSTQMMAVALNALAGVGALALAAHWRRPESERGGSAGSRAAHDNAQRGLATPDRSVPTVSPELAYAALALALSGFAAMGLEIVWLRHFNLLLGGFRAVFSLLLFILLLAMGAGSVLGGVIHRRTARPAQALMMVQALLVVSALFGIASTSMTALVAEGRSVEATLNLLTPFERIMSELWYNARPILFEVGLPALCMGCSFPLANGVIQRTENVVGRRAGALYLANTAGAVCGALVAGYVLLPSFGIQGSAAALAIAAGLAIVPLHFAARHSDRSISVRHAWAAASAGAVALLIAFVSIWAWTLLPSDYVLRRSMVLAADERVLATSEGVTELIAVTEAPGRGRGLLTNGHPMASTALLDQRYMRALAHIPLLSMDRPRDVLVIGFGVGNTAHAATLHPSIRRVEVADLSRHVLEHAPYFRDANGGVLDDRRVAVYVNDGRTHLQTQRDSIYDLITLEPPPIAHAGVAALYSREFYALARRRLKPGGYVSQWLPAYQVPVQTTLAMVRAFIDVFPQAVLLSGAQAELLLLGTTGAKIAIDPDRILRTVADTPSLAADLRRLDLGSAVEIVGTFVGSAETLATASSQSTSASDDRPLQEYGVRSAIGTRFLGVPASIFNVADVRAWCPRCFDGDRIVPSVAGLDIYLGLLDEAYHAPVAEVAAVAASAGGRRRLLGSAYLGAVVPDNAQVHNLLGIALGRESRHEEALAEFMVALGRDADSAATHRNVSDALEALGRHDESLVYLRRAMQLDPDDGEGRYELGRRLLDQGEFAEAADHLRHAVRLLPEHAPAYNDLGVALASIGDLDRAIDSFQAAVTLQPDFDAARRNLSAARSGER